MNGPMVGMASVGVRQLAQSLDDASARLDAVARDLGRDLVFSPWHGRDADGFAREWDGVRQFLRSCATALGEAAAAARRNADEQDKASRGSEAGSGAGGARPYASMTADELPGYDSRPGDYRRGKYGRDRDMLDLASACYWNEKEGRFGTPPKGWSEVSDAELRDLGVDPSILGEYGSPFSARVYRDIDGNFVVAYEGTDPDNALDWVENAGGAVWTSPSDGRAVAVARTMHGALEGTGHSLEFTGHSAGGRQAILAGQATGDRVVSFNTAPVSGIEQGIVALTGGHDPSITNYATNNDPLTIANFRSGNVPPGTYVFLDPIVRPEKTLHILNSPGDNASRLIAGHNTSAIADGFNRLVVQEEEWY